MRATGIVRRIDDLGRILIPKEIRRTLNVIEGDPLELFLDMTDKEHPYLCMTKITGNDGQSVLMDFITRLKGIKRDLYYDEEKDIADKINNVIKLLEDNKDKFDF